MKYCELSFYSNSKNYNFRKTKQNSKSASCNWDVLSFIYTNWKKSFTNSFGDFGESDAYSDSNRRLLVTLKMLTT